MVDFFLHFKADRYIHFIGFEEAIVSDEVWALDLDYEKLAECRKARILKPIYVKDLAVLDAGTGEGAMAAYLAKRIGNGVIVSVDIDPKCLEMAKRRLEKEDLLSKVSLREADLRGLDFIKKVFYRCVGRIWHSRVHRGLHPWRDHTNP